MWIKLSFCFDTQIVQTCFIYQKYINSHMIAITPSSDTTAWDSPRFNFPVKSDAKALTSKIDLKKIFLFLKLYTLKKFSVNKSYLKKCVTDGSQYVTQMADGEENYKIIVE